MKSRPGLDVSGTGLLQLFEAMKTADRGAVLPPEHVIHSRRVRLFQPLPTDRRHVLLRVIDWEAVLRDLELAHNGGTAPAAKYCFWGASSRILPNRLCFLHTSPVPIASWPTVVPLS